MNIEKLIHDLRARINPQYYDQLGTESYERHQCVMALESLLARNEVLREENERLRKDAAVSAAIERAAKDLPDGDMLEITVEKDSAMVVLYWGQGGFETMDVDDDNRLAAEINAAIDAARGAK